MSKASVFPVQMAIQPIDSTPKAERAFIRRAYWTAFSLQGVVGFIGWYLTFVAKIPFLQDAAFYEEVGHSIATDWLAGRSSTWLANRADMPHQPFLMVITIACFYVLTLGVRLTPIAITCYGFITAFTPTYVFRISRLMGVSFRSCKNVTWLVAVLPAFLFFSGSLHKEGIVLLCLCLSVYHTMMLQRRFDVRSGVIVFVCLLSLCFLRLYLAAIMAMVLAFSVMLAKPSRLTSSQQASFAAGRVFVFFAFVLMMAAVGTVGQIYNVWPHDLDEGFELMQVSRLDAARADSGYLPDADISSPLKALMFLPIGAFYFMTVPFPWDFGNLKQNIAIPETILWVCLYPIVLIGMLRSLRRNFQGSVVLLSGMIAMMCFYGIFMGNIGTAYRMRIQVWLLCAVFLGSGLDYLRGYEPDRAKQPQRRLPFNRFLQQRPVRGPRVRVARVEAE